MSRPLLCLVIVFLACGIVEPLFGPDLDTINLRYLAPFPEYQVWHSEMESCMRRQRSFHRIRWFVADSLFFNGGEAGGWWKEPNDIVLRADGIRHPGIVKAELGHYLRQDSKHTNRLALCIL